MALSGTEEMFKAVVAEKVKLVSSEKRYFEIVKLEQPSPETIARSSEVQNLRGETGFIKALGKLHVKAWVGPGYEEEDATDDEDNGVPTSTNGSVKVFYLEHDILEYFLVGMKMEVMVHELNIGVKFFDYVAGLYCSFHTYLPNEKMLGWKEPSKSLQTMSDEGLTDGELIPNPDPNTRPPPTEDDPEAEEGAMMGEMEKDFEKDEKLSKKLTIQTNVENPAAESKTQATDETEESAN